MTALGTTFFSIKITVIYIASNSDLTHKYNSNCILITQLLRLESDIYLKELICRI